jgi:hypothetical protein
VEGQDYGTKRFVRKLNHDLAAVKNALRESWSNGPVEGHVNRLKTLKRQIMVEPASNSYEPDCCRCLAAPRCSEIEEEPQ